MKYTLSVLFILFAFSSLVPLAGEIVPERRFPPGINPETGKPDRSRPHVPGQPKMTASVKAGFHTFTNNDGAIIHAKITDVVGDNVSIKRDDGFSFTSDISGYSKSDQDYIRKWELGRILKNMDLDIQASKVTETLYSEEKELQSIHHSASHFKIKVKNNSAYDLKYITGKYVLYKKIVDAGKEPEIRRRTGTIRIPHILSAGRYDFSTKIVTLANTKLTKMHVDIDKEAERTFNKSESLAGIKIRFYMKGILISQFAKMSGIVDDQPWPRSVRPTLKKL